MAVNKPNSAGIVTGDSIIGMYDSVKDTVNSSGTDTISDSAFGKQVLPSCIPNLVGSSTAGCANVAGSTVTIPSSTAAYQMYQETADDVTGSSAWGEIVKLDAGYLLPPCKVLVMFDATISDIVKHSDDAAGLGQAWFSVYHTANYGGADVIEWDLQNMGMLFTYKHARTVTGSTTTTASLNHAEESISIWYLIDKTGLADNWTLKSIKAVGALGIGNQINARIPVSIVVANSNLSFVSFYKDS